MFALVGFGSIFSKFRNSNMSKASSICARLLKFPPGGHKTQMNEGVEEQIAATVPATHYTSKLPLLPRFLLRLAPAEAHAVHKPTTTL